MACEVCGPDGCIESPCFNCGTYRHETAYCKQDTIHTCGANHDCPDKPPCGCERQGLSYEEVLELYK